MFDASGSKGRIDAKDTYITSVPKIRKAYMRQWVQNYQHYQVELATKKTYEKVEEEARALTWIVGKKKTSPC